MPSAAAPEPVVDDNLLPWPAVSRAAAWSGLLIGNGASCAVWPRFGYRSLYEHASLAIPGPERLSPTDKALFSALTTTDFESVLRALGLTQLVLGALAADEPAVMQRYQHIRAALIAAVHSIHLRWTPQLRDRSLHAIRAYLRTVRAVYSTNYDLIVYWAMASQGRAGLDEFVDFMWSGTPPAFDPLNTEIWESRRAATRVYYLHGALHLYRLRDGPTNKMVADEAALLDSVGKLTIPQFVSEGTWRQKFSRISESAYLTFAYQHFRNHDGPTVVFGHSLNEDTDGHIVKAMQQWARRRVAISILPRGKGVARSEKLRMMRLFPNLDLSFFHALTHPLGHITLRADLQ